MTITEKLERLASWIAVAALPVGTRMIFFNAGRPGTEWNAVFVSLTDILIIIWALLFTIRRFSAVNTGLKRDAVVCILCLFLVIAGISSVQGGALSLFRVAKLMIFVLFAFLVTDAVRREGHKRILAIFIASVFLQSLLGGAQFFLQHDLGFQLLGESPLGEKASGVAKFDVGGAKIVRAYGTFPHPNVFAAYIAAAVFFVLSFVVEKRRLRVLAPKEAVLFALLIGALTFGLLVTFSRGILISFAAGAVFFIATAVKQRMFRERTMLLGLAATVITSFLVLGFVFAPFLSGRVKVFEDQAFLSRIFYVDAAFGMLQNHPFAGIGWGRFADVLPKYVTPKPLAVPSASFPLWIMQPVHNIYLLIAAEAGVPALIVFAAFIYALMRSAVFSRDVYVLGASGAFVMLLIAGLADHFPITVQQGALLFWFLAGILMAGVKRET